AGAYAGGKRRLVPAARQAAIRGRPRGDRQGRIAERSLARAENRRRHGRMAEFAWRLAEPWCSPLPDFRRRRKQGISACRAKDMSTETVKIETIGSGGDGVAATNEGAVFVPFTLPGETVAIARVKNHGTVMSWSETSPERVAPRCRHFGPEGKGGACGGCQLQHWADSPYHEYK